jgi:hypothetical protein
MKVFTYCIYGSNPKYCEGLVRNLEQIESLFPDFSVIVIAGSNVPEDYITKYKSFKNVKLSQYKINDHRLMCYRFFAIDDPDITMMFVRDADSRITERDIWCINQFMTDSHSIFTIRDHPHHRPLLMGGLWGMKKMPGFSIKQLYSVFLKLYNGNLNMYDVDQQFIAEFIYKPFRKHIVVYTTNFIYPGENIVQIELPRRDKYDFCGNVIDYDQSGNEYFVYNITGFETKN